MSTDARTPMPAVFFGHGSPMNAPDHNRYTEELFAVDSGPTATSAERPPERVREPVGVPADESNI